MKIAFAATPRFGALVLGALLGSAHEVVLVITQPDRPAGRGRELGISAVKELAFREGLRVEQSEDISSPEVIELLESLGVKTLTVAAFGQILKGSLLNALPCINVHGSLLPKYRGAAPVERAIMDGERVTGVTIMDITPKLDTGPAYTSRAVYIEDDDDAGSMYEKLGRAGGEALVDVLDALDAGKIEPTEQNEDAATYAEKITSADMEIDWSRPAREIAAQVRGLSPYIGAFTRANGQRLKVWKARVSEGGDGPGTTLIEGERLMVSCGTGMLELIEVQPEGKRRMGAAEFLRGHRKMVEENIMGQ
ncbi:MAG: methionyl-tRNA formyltransferase [Thermoleophilia bacterium]